MNQRRRYKAKARRAVSRWASDVCALNGYPLRRFVADGYAMDFSDVRSGPRRQRALDRQKAALGLAVVVRAEFTG